MEIFSELNDICEKANDHAISRIDQVFENRQKNGIERVVRNHLLTQRAAASVCNGISSPTFKNHYEEVLASGKIDVVINEGPKKLYSLKMMHTIMEHIGVPKWYDTHAYTHVINVQNQKGGTGKSTYAVNCAVAIALPLETRIRTLIVDLDPQGSLRTFLAPQAEYDNDLLSAVDIMLGDDEPDGLYADYKSNDYDHAQIVRGSIQESHIPNLHILPAFSDDERFSSAAWTHYAKHNEFPHIKYLKEKIIDVIRDDYDVIIIDTGPQINPLVWAAQHASNGMLVPVTPHQLDWASTWNFLRNTPGQAKINLPDQGKNIKWMKVALTNVDTAKDIKIANDIRTDLGSFMMANELVRSDAFEAAAKNYCTVLDIKKVEKLCGDRALQDAQSSIKALTRELLGVLNLAEHKALAV
jgi:chromosome partitioning protein